MIKLYHATNVSFNSFIIPFGGLHMGSYDSAIQAVSRKQLDDVFYLHICEIDIASLNGTNCIDIGGCPESWDEYKDNWDFMYYSNLFERSFEQSFVFFTDKCLSYINIISTEIIKSSELDNMLTDIENRLYLYEDYTGYN